MSPEIELGTSRTQGRALTLIYLMHDHGILRDISFGSRQLRAKILLKFWLQAKPVNSTVWFSLFNNTNDSKIFINTLKQHIKKLWMDRNCKKINPAKGIIVSQNRARFL